MDKFNVEKDNISTPSQGGRNLHTYTPRSHEDLLRSHLQLDAARNAKLQNDLQRLAAENNVLRMELNQARHDLRNKDEEIEALYIKLKRPRTPTSQLRVDQSWKPDTVFELIKQDELVPLLTTGGGPLLRVAAQIFASVQDSLQVDGKLVTLEKLISHFNGVIQRHHDLINKKNILIRQLQDALKNQQPFQSRTTESFQHRTDEALSHNLMSEFSKQLEKIKREYEHVENILTERNDKLEKLIEELQNKLGEYATEIQYLRSELTTGTARENTQPTESTAQLLKAKEKENDYLKEIISTLKVQRTNNVILNEPQIPNEDLENEVKRIIESKKDTILKLNNIIDEVRSQPSDIALGTPGNINLTEVETDCQAMISELNTLNEKLNNMLKKLKESSISSPIEGDVDKKPVDKSNLISNLENLKKQIQDDIDTLKNKVGGTDSTLDAAVILRGQAVVRIDDPSYLKKRALVTESEGETGVDSSAEPIETSSNIKFMLYPSTPQYQQPRRQRVENVEFPRMDDFRHLIPQTSYTLDMTKHYPITSCEACSAPPDTPVVTHIPSRRNVEFMSRKKSSIKDMVLRKKSSQKVSVPRKKSSAKDIGSRKKSSIKDRTPSPKRHLIQDLFKTSRPKSTEREIKGEVKEKPKPKGGCCAKQGSDTSYTPYTKHNEREKIVSIHNPHEIPQRPYPDRSIDYLSSDFQGAKRRQRTKFFSQERKIK
ncbi:hypothetical protein J6590_023291 [Homalodisca vitripennis]|nr:hypothetical protein J6590_023291 [Homalodisca vitripennis]